MLRFTFYLLSICFALVCLTDARANDARDDYTNALRDGVLLVQLEKWRLASDHWRDQIVKFEDDEEITKTDTALLYVLGAISLERADDARAYEAWTRALGLLLADGVNWVQYQRALRSQIDEVKYLLGSSFSSEGASVTGSTKDALILESLDAFLSLTTYEGPAPGLTEHKEEEVAASTIAKPYFPQIALGNEGGGEAVDNKLRHAEAETADAPNGEQGNNIARGVQPVDPDLETLTVTRKSRAMDEDVPAPIAQPSTPVQSIAMQTIGDEEEQVEVLSDVARSRRLRSASFDALSYEDMQSAKTAWRFFENNRQSNTGLYNSVDGYHFTTMWDLGSSLAAIFSAYHIGILDQQTFESYINMMLTTLADMPLYDGVLPNREYDTRSAMMVDLSSQPNALGERLLVHRHCAHIDMVTRDQDFLSGI